MKAWLIEKGNVYENTVKTKLRRAREKIKEKYERSDLYG